MTNQVMAVDRGRSRKYFRLIAPVAMALGVVVLAFGTGWGVLVVGILAAIQASFIPSEFLVTALVGELFFGSLFLFVFGPRLIGLKGREDRNVSPAERKQNGPATTREHVQSAFGVLLFITGTVVGWCFFSSLAPNGRPDVTTGAFFLGLIGSLLMKKSVVSPLFFRLLSGLLTLISLYVWWVGGW